MDIKVIEYKGKTYSVVGEGKTEYLVTEPWFEEEGELIRIPKDELRVNNAEE